MAGDFIRARLGLPNPVPRHEEPFLGVSRREEIQVLQISRSRQWAVIRKERVESAP